MYRFREICSLNHDCAWKSYRGMECDLNGLKSIWYVNGHVDILYSYDVSFAVQYTYTFIFHCLVKKTTKQTAAVIGRSTLSINVTFKSYDK